MDFNGDGAAHGGERIGRRGETRKRIQALEERTVQRERETVELSARLSRLAATVQAIRASAPLPPFGGGILQPSDARALGDLCFRHISAKGTSTAAAPDPRPPVLPPSQTLPPAPSAPSTIALPPAGFASLIVADFPALFAEFREERFTLLSRGTRDGLDARCFHGRCDGHTPTLTLIQDMEGNIFRGFTPVEWES